jgi:hypothetical protein
MNVCVCVYTHTHAEGAQITGTRSPKQLSLAQWLPLFVGPQYELASCHHSGAWTSDRATRSLKNL